MCERDESNGNPFLSSVVPLSLLLLHLMLACALLAFDLALFLLLCLQLMTSRSPFGLLLLLVVVDDNELPLGLRRRSKCAMLATLLAVVVALVVVNGQISK